MAHYSAIPINIRKLSYEDALSIIRAWLDECDKLKPLVNVNDKIKPNLSAEARLLANKLISCQIK